ncbi:unnamed protein product [Eruca vesicaria subsp. sativa]|uniref:Uncharacterized protein n=1 Tax=Eruca vesicaria subsp. sativa TaxID=29727 RepID=A0ABC8LKC8_ERUVS|nr:unnamed protein product [Eruca vesicaria subsp. sativa]
MMVLEDFGMHEKIVSAELSYFPSSLMSNLGIPPVVISNDRQVCSFIGYRKKNSSIYLCVSFTGEEEHLKQTLTQVEIRNQKEDSSERGFVGERRRV